MVVRSPFRLNSFSQKPHTISRPSLGITCSVKGMLMHFSIICAFTLRNSMHNSSYNLCGVLTRCGGNWKDASVILIQMY